MAERFAGLTRRPAPAGYSWMGRALTRGRWHLIGDTRRATAFVDLAAAPPTPVLHPNVYAIAFDELPDGRFVACAMPTNPVGNYGVYLYAADWPTNPAAEPLGAVPCPGGIGMVNVWALAGRVVAHDRLIDGKQPPATHRAYLLDGDRWREAPGLPPVTRFKGAKFLRHQAHGNGKVTLGDGTDVFVWDGDGYEWTGTRFERRWELAAGGAHLHGLVALPWGTGGFLFLSEGRVMFARRGRKPVRVLADVPYAHHLGPGPNGSVFVCTVRDPKSYLARQWFPDEGTYAPIARGHLNFGPSWGSPALHWSAATKLVHVSALDTFPDSSLNGLKRVTPRAGGYRIEPEADPRAAGDARPAPGGELVEREFLTLPVWDRLDPGTAETVARAVARCLPDPWRFARVARCACGDQKRNVAFFVWNEHEFALVPGGTVELGYDPARPPPPARLLRVWAAEARALTGSTGPPEALWRRYLERQLSGPRTVELGPYLIAASATPKRFKTGRAERSRIAKEGFALPTADQWEFAASGGSRAVWHWGDAPARTPPKANAFGLAIARDAYDQEALAVPGHYRGGDGGTRAHGGCGALEAQVPLSPWFAARASAKQEDRWERSVYRRVLVLPGAMLG